MSDEDEAQTHFMHGIIIYCTQITSYTNTVNQN